MYIYNIEVAEDVLEAAAKFIPEVEKLLTFLEKNNVNRSKVLLCNGGLSS